MKILSVIKSPLLRMGDEKSRQIVQLWVHTYSAIERSFLLYKLKILKMHQCTNGTILIFDGREQTAENDTFQRVEGGIKTYVCSRAKLEPVQDFFIKLDMKPCMHLVEISIFSLNRADKNWAQF